MWGMTSYYGAKSKVGKKKKKTGWFEKLTVDQLKQLARASKLTVGGNKDDLVARLVQCPSTAPYNNETRFNLMALANAQSDDEPSPEGKTLDGLKAECKQRGLSATGKKFDLALRLLQDENGVGEPKRARLEVLDPRTGAPVLWKRKQSTKPPDIDKLVDRVMARAQKTPTSDYGWKHQAGDLLSYCTKIIEKEAIDKGFLETDVGLALEILCSVMETAVEEMQGMYGWGRACWELAWANEIATKIFGALRASQHALDEDDVVRHKGWVKGIIDGYAQHVGCEFNKFKEELEFLNELSSSDVRMHSPRMRGHASAASCCRPAAVLNPASA